MFSFELLTGVGSIVVIGTSIIVEADIEISEALLFTNIILFSLITGIAFTFTEFELSSLFIFFAKSLTLFIVSGVAAAGIFIATPPILNTFPLHSSISVTLIFSAFS
ncbi:hypothetical protein SDC9_146716 [bioreactor metagenome]|uniref:Uncharacterized protein n=1 Tax=bioreactor metagenome TaxID=1076179 RepID=A0A645EBV0_9ZZZZ